MCLVPSLVFLICFIFQLSYAEVYIVNLKPSPNFGALKTNTDEDRRSIIERHDEILKSLSSQTLSKDSDDNEENSIKKVYSYTNVFDGFSAKLTKEQASTLRENKEVLQVREIKIYKPLTTRSYSFLGLDAKNGPWSITNGSDVIIGLFDSGVWPEDPSFSDTGLGPVPKRFKGICQEGAYFTKKNCNRKLIGARYYGQGYSFAAGIPLTSPRLGDYASPRDMGGHGSHTSSTAAGSIVSRTSIRGRDYGTAKGMAFNARIVMYKVCWGSDGGCTDADIVAAMDKAIDDGVDVFSLSLGGSPSKAYDDAISKASYTAVLRGIPVVLAGGNEGPAAETVSNGSPWQLTVGASTIDRTFANAVVLGNKQKVYGISLTKGTFPINKFISLISSENAKAEGQESTSAMNCYPKSLSKAKVNGKIVVCMYGGPREITRFSRSEEVKRVGGVGFILVNLKSYGSSLSTLLPNFFNLPGIHIGYNDGVKVFKYIKSNSKPMAYLSEEKTRFGNKSVEAPIVTGFSSTGPNFLSYNVLKPDVIAPGHSIVAAWTQSKDGGVFYNQKPSAFSIISGTSMACPHAAGIVALIKARHPSWMPSWIYSAIMTTASVVNNQGNPLRNSFGSRASPFDMGAGHVNAAAALNPGLVYSISPAEYDTFLCSPSGWEFCFPSTREIDLNLPSLSLTQVSKAVSVTRKVTLVGPPATYRVRVAAPYGVSVAVTPTVLKFTKAGQRLSYRIRVLPEQVPTLGEENYRSGFTFGKIVWSDGAHNVAINVAVNLLSNPS